MPPNDISACEKVAPLSNRPEIVAKPTSLTISIKVKPGSRRESMRFENDLVVIQIKSPAVEGKANDGLIAYLSDLLRIPKSRIAIKSGHTARFKRIELPDEAAQMLIEIAKGRKNP